MPNTTPTVALAGLLSLLISAPAGRGEDPIMERGGIAAFEAEDGTGDWTIIESPTGRAIQDPGAGTMRYTIRFTETGRYYVFLLARQGPAGRDKENDVILRLSGERLFASDNTTRPDGMRSYGDWKWTQLPKGPGAHTPRTIFRDPVYFLVREPGDHVFEIIHRSTNFAVDKVVMKLNDPQPPPEAVPAAPATATSP